MSFLLYLARRRDFVQRLTIQRQRDELNRLNAGLSQRVREQVSEIVARAAEVEQLNAQLQAQVRARSSELSLALARLASQRGSDGRLHRGTVLGDRFMVEAALGEGGMGAVYAGVDRSTHGRVAIKVIQATSSGQLDALHRFLREARAAAAVTHPAVVRMLHVDVSDDGLLFQVQELVEGEALSRRLGRKWPVADAARLCSVLCAALAAAHRQGIVHRDVKPANIMLTASAPGMKLIDFGIAKLRDEVKGIGEKTTSGQVIGTPSFMAPEQVRGDLDVSDRADVYAVGIMLYRLVTEKLPFEGKTPLEQMTGRLTGPAPDIRHRDPSVPDELAQLIGSCLLREPGDRPAAALLARDLCAFADRHGARPLEKIAQEHAMTEDTLGMTTVTAAAGRG
jgi:serine/threonine-protein kinase